jgi:hypothetical protein
LDPSLGHFRISSAVLHESGSTSAEHRGWTGASLSSSHTCDLHFAHSALVQLWTGECSTTWAALAGGACQCRR